MAKVWLDVGMNYIPLTWLSSFHFTSKIHLLMNNPPIMSPSGPSERSALGLPLVAISEHCCFVFLRCRHNSVLLLSLVLMWGGTLYPPIAQHPPYPEFMYYLVFVLQGSPDCLESACSVLNSLPPLWGFPDSSVGKESACNVRDPDSIPGSGGSPAEGIGYLLQSSWASLVAQLVKNPPAIWETWVLSLGWEDPLEKGKATHSSILAWEIPWTEEPAGL